MSTTEQQFLVTVQRWRRENPEARQRQLEAMQAQIKEHAKTGTVGQNLTCEGMVTQNPFAPSLIAMLLQHDYRLDRISFQYYKSCVEDTLDIERDWFEAVFSPAAKLADSDADYCWRASMIDPSCKEADVSVF